MTTNDRLYILGLSCAMTIGHLNSSNEKLMGAVTIIIVGTICHFIFLPKE